MPYSLYLHIPFCTHRCAYCDFNTYAGQESLIPAYLEALCNEIRCVALKIPTPFGGGTRSEGGGAIGEGVNTIFFGGGTPSLLTPLQFEKILQTIRTSFNLTSSETSDTSDTSETVGTSNASGTFGTSGTFSFLEISLEANPATVNLDSLRGLRQVGFNRLSFGVQSFHPDELRLLERIHDPFDVLQAVRWARQAGFGNLNLDLIYGLPEQTLSRWKDSLRWAVGLAPEHLSLYALTIESATPFGRWARAGLLPIPDPDLAADMYEAAADYLEGQGYEQYEISNWSRPGFQCRHNLQVWRNLPYLGFGAGAHGCANGLRIANVLRIKTYLDRVSHDCLNPEYLFPISPATVSKSRLTLRDEMQETMLLGLRLTQEGVSTQTFHDRFGQEMQDIFGKEMDELIGLGLLEWASTPPPSGEGPGMRVRLTPRGRLLGNQVFLRFVGD